MSTILIIEDEARIAAFIAKGLKSAGFASHATASGAEGASLALHGGFDLVVLDWVCPTSTASRCWSGSAARG